MDQLFVFLAMAPVLLAIGACFGWCYTDRKLNHKERVAAYNRWYRRFVEQLCRDCEQRQHNCLEMKKLPERRGCTKIRMECQDAMPEGSAFATTRRSR